MIWASSQLIVGYYFERYRPMANGFSCSGGGAGIVLFTFLNSWLVPIIGWRNMLRTQAGLIMLILLMVVAYVEVAPTQVGMYHLPGSSDTSSDEYYGNFYVHDYLRQSAMTAKSRSILSTYEPHPKRKDAPSSAPPVRTVVGGGGRSRKMLMSRICSSARRPWSGRISSIRVLPNTKSRTARRTSTARSSY